ncbi:MAG: hypothetical protein FWD75_04465 [Propionibacteriaceae bacterium]|nr:hypothetical protein [Propionibacteriaceae bacterium]
MTATIDRLELELVDETRHTLMQGSLHIQDRLDTLVADMAAMGDGQGAWFQALTATKERWDAQMQRLMHVLATESE